MTPQASRPRSYARWELRACARHGHATYEPTGDGDEGLRSRVHTATPQGDAWRCLRCGDYVVGAPTASGPSAEAPIVLRGRALRDAVVVRALAVERALRALVLVAAAYAIHRFDADKDALQRLFDRDLPALRDFGARVHVDVESNVIVRTVQHLLTTRSSTLTWVAVIAAAYATIEAVEAVGLWLLRRWGEYFTAVATAVFVPLEVYELTEHLTVTKLLALVVNVAAVVYLVVSKHLFGARGGAAEYYRERRTESLLEVEVAAATAETGVSRR